MERLKISKNTFTYNLTIQYFCEKKNLEEAKKLLDEMRKEGIPRNFYSYFPILEYYTTEFLYEEARVIYKIMKEEGIEDLKYFSKILEN